MKFTSSFVQDLGRRPVREILVTVQPDEERRLQIREPMKPEPPKTRTRGRRDGLEGGSFNESEPLKTMVRERRDAAHAAPGGVKLYNDSNVAVKINKISARTACLMVYRMAINF